jgi:hypothetical protein
LVNKLDQSDFFVQTDTMFFLRTELKNMLERDEINSVERNYGRDQGYNRIR